MSAKTGIRRGFNFSLVTMSALALSISKPRSAEANGSVCVTSPENTTEVCVSWSRVLDPNVPGDLTVEFSDEYTPIVTLKSGDLGWNIIVEDLGSSTPGNLGAVRLSPNSHGENFGVSFSDGLNAAVNNVGDINLTAIGWSGYSNINGGTIGGDISGAVIAKPNALGVGGVLTGDFYVWGDLGGPLKVSRVVDAYVDIVGEVQTGFTVSNGVSYSNIGFQGDIPADVTLYIHTLEDSTLKIGEGFTFPAGQMAGILRLGKGLSSTGEVYIWHRLVSPGKIDFNDGDIAGRFELIAGGDGDIINGGIVKTSGHLWVSTLEENTFSGNATFAAIEEFGAVEAEYSNIDGTITILGDLNGYLWVRVGPLLENGYFHVLGNVGDTGSINIAGVTDFGGDLLGTVQVEGKMLGNINVEGTVIGTIKAGGVLGGGQYPWSGRIDISGDVAGTIAIGAIESGGSVNVSNDISGDIEIGSIYNGFVFGANDLSGKIEVAETLAGGSIYVEQNVTTTAHVSVKNLGANYPVISLGSGEIGQYLMDGRVDIYSGVPIDTYLAITAETGPNAVIDLHNGGVGGYITMDGGGYGQLVNGGVLKTSGHVWVATGDAVWRGHATFSSSEQWGTIDAEAGDVDGIVEFTGKHYGQVVIRGGNLFSNGELRFDVGVGSTGAAYVWGFDGVTGNCDGKIIVNGKMAGTIEVTRNYSPTAQINISADLYGSIRLYQGSRSGSQINLGGIAAGGTLVVNDEEGQFDADGDIRVGSPLSISPKVIYDGCIRVRKYSGGGFGDLNGDINIWGCHSTPDPLNICIDGTINGNINIHQTGCANQVTWTCGGCR